VITVIPPIADLDATHVTNALWPAHARLHTVWLISTNSMIGLVAMTLLWSRRTRPSATAFRLASVLVGAVLGGFFVAAATAAAYGGALTDPNGIPFTVGPIDANLAVFGACASLLGVAQCLW
jgi:hypothetical protein